MPETVHSTLSSLLDGGPALLGRGVPFEPRDVFRTRAGPEHPHTLFITCADSRISPGMITQSAPGNLFNLRNIGNIVPAYGEMLGGVSAAIEYAVVALGCQPHHRLRAFRLRRDEGDDRAAQARAGAHADGVVLAAQRRGGARAVTQALLSQSGTGGGPGVRCRIAGR